MTYERTLFLTSIESINTIPGGRLSHKVSMVRDRFLHLTSENEVCNHYGCVKKTFAGQEYCRLHYLAWKKGTGIAKKIKFN